MEYEQLSIFDYLPPCTNFPQLIADELVKHCEKWGYDYVERLKQQGGRQFYNIFCRITKTYFVHKGPEEYYEVEFSKNGKAVVKRCACSLCNPAPLSAAKQFHVIRVGGSL
ncbi:MAG: hypothetical protein K2N61_13245 [Lachnospiraceae bacterium]|nr:hypothetical protein [Lachnospiraceae bacterium]